jgi:hypothetical protein
MCKSDVNTTACIETQANSYALHYPPDPRNDSSYSGLCSLLQNFPLFTRIPIYATTPVISSGPFARPLRLYSTCINHNPNSLLSETSYSYSSSHQDEPHVLLQPPTAEEIAAYFSLIHPLKYSQPHQPLPSLSLRLSTGLPSLHTMLDIL